MHFSEKLKSEFSDDYKPMKFRPNILENIKLNKLGNN